MDDYCFTYCDGLSSFAVLCTAVGGQVGTGNLAGVATAIASGGPGAVFWMWIIGIIGMGTSFAEAVLAQLFREKNEDGTYRGGPAYYLANGLHCKPLAIFFSIVTIVDAGFIVASLQSNSIASGFKGVIDINPLIIGIIMSITTGLVIFGGIKRLSDIAKYIVPIMAGLYLVVALFCVVINIRQLPGVFAIVFEGGRLLLRVLREAQLDLPSKKRFIMAAPGDFFQMKPDKELLPRFMRRQMWRIRQRRGLLPCSA